MKASSRIVNYSKQNGSKNLTPKQRRRVAKKAKIADKRRFARMVKKAESGETHE